MIKINGQPFVRLYNARWCKGSIVGSYPTDIGSNPFLAI